MIEQQISKLRQLAEKNITILIAAKAREIDEGYKKTFDQQILSLEKLLNDTEIKPYKVAIVGSFKVGKSSFVNALCDTQIASVNTNPETANITIFKYNKLPTTQIYFTSKEEWNEMKEEYNKDPSGIFQSRYAKIYKLETSNKLCDEHNTNLLELESKYITTPNFIKKIECQDWEDTKLRKEFTDKIKKYTSSSSPIHYLVEKLVVEIPVQLLQQNVELIDTPGLDDPDIYRVSMTENCVKDVDAILFLTQSGNSYSQSNKDFLIKQLRRQTIKQLRIIVTKCDETYINAITDAEDNESDIPTYSDHKAREEKRLREQFKTTLDEIIARSDINETETDYFIGKLDDIKINFISSKYHKKKRQDLDIESGIENLCQDLLQMLDESERNIGNRQILFDGIENVCNRVSMTSQARLEAISDEFNSDQVRRQLQNVDSRIEQELKSFEKIIENHVEFFKKENDLGKEVTDLHIQSILDLASNVVSEYAMSDVKRHWRTRRSGGWGYINHIQNNIADRIFPKLEVILNRYVANFKNLLGKIKTALNVLQKKLIILEERNHVQTSTPLRITHDFEVRYNRLINELNPFINSQRNNISRYLDKFLSDEVIEKIESARIKVKNIQGRGTTILQHKEVDNFYEFLKSSLSQALKEHIDKQVQLFIDQLQNKALLISPEISITLDTIIDDRLNAIEIGLIEITKEEKSSLIKYLEDLVENIISIETELRQYDLNTQ